MTIYTLEWRLDMKAINASHSAPIITHKSYFDTQAKAEAKQAELKAAAQMLKVEPHLTVFLVAQGVE
jgi:hypothetical protein